jgi:hypothetical protein
MYAAPPQIDVPWIHWLDLPLGGNAIAAVVSANEGAARIGHITFTGVNLYRQMTFIQSGVTAESHTLP